MIRIDFKSGYYSSQMVDCTIFVGSRKYSDARVVDIHVRYLYSYQKRRANTLRGSAITVDISVNAVYHCFLSCVII